MSGDEELDNLLFSMSRPSKKNSEPDIKDDPQAEAAKQAPGKADASEQASGFDPLDLVDLEERQRSLITWLTRHPQALFSDIEEAFEIPKEDLENILTQLIDEQRIKCVEKDGELCYSAPIRAQANRRLRGFPEDLWKKAGLDND